MTKKPEDKANAKNKGDSDKEHPKSAKSADQQPKDPKPQDPQPPADDNQETKNHDSVAVLPVKAKNQHLTFIRPFHINNAPNNLVIGGRLHKYHEHKFNPEKQRAEHVLETYVAFDAETAIKELTASGWTQEELF